MLFGTVSAADAFAWAMLAVIFLGLGMVLVLVLAIRRGSARRDPEVEALLDELERAEKSPAVGGKSRAEPWVRDADWWRKG